MGLYLGTPVLSEINVKQVVQLLLAQKSNKTVQEAKLYVTCLEKYSSGCEVFKYRNHRSSRTLL